MLGVIPAEKCLDTNKALSVVPVYRLEIEAQLIPRGEGIPEFPLDFAAALD
jgi:hypothetical protein